jgi:Ferritin-like domain
MMQRRGGRDERGKWTRRRLLRAALGGGAVVAGGTVIGARGDSGTSVAAPSKDRDAEILNLFLLLEFVQEDFYREALESGRLSGELLRLARTVGAQETKHVTFLVERLGNRARARPRTDFGDTLSTPEQFRDAAIELEEAAIAAYIGQGANLTRETVGPVATLVSVEARQAAWLRDLAGVSPAPRAADPARRPDDVVADLRAQGVIG